MDKGGATCCHMQPSARDKRIRIGAGLVIMALAVLSVFMVFASGHARWADIPLGVLYWHPGAVRLPAVVDARSPVHGEGSFTGQLS